MIAMSKKEKACKIRFQNASSNSVLMTAGVVVFFCLCPFMHLEAQLRSDQASINEFSGPIFRPDPSDHSRQARVGFLHGVSKRISMNHSFEFTAGSFGGEGFVQNMYTNSLFFQISPKWDARLDAGIAYSPTQHSFLNASGAKNQPRFLIRNAEVNYRPNPRTRLHLSFSQDPFYMSSRYGFLGTNPFYSNRRPHPVNESFLGY